MAFNIQDEVKLNTILDSANNSGNAGQLLSSAGSNTLLWVDSGSITVPGNNTEIFFNNYGILGANNQFVFDKETGRVGIGESAPEVPLHIQGDPVLGPVTDIWYKDDFAGMILEAPESRLQIVSNDNGGDGSTFILSTGTNNWVQGATGPGWGNSFRVGYVQAASDSNFATMSSLPRMFEIYPSGDVIFNNDGADADFRVESDTNTHALFVQGSDGYVGFGQSAPLAPLHVRDDSAELILECSTFTATSTALGDKDSRLFFDWQTNTAGSGGEVVWGVNNNPTGRWAAVSGHLESEVLGEASGGIVFGTKAARSDATLANRLHIKGYNEAVFNEDGDNYNFRVESNNNANMLFVDGGNDRVGIGTSAVNAEVLHLYNGASGRTVFNQAADDLVIENSANVGLTLATDAANMSSIFFSNQFGQSAGAIQYVHSSNYTRMYTNYKEWVRATEFATTFNELGYDKDLFVNTQTNSPTLFVRGSDGFIGVNQSAPTFRFDLVDDAAAYVDGEKSVASFSSASDQRSFLKIRNNNGNATAGAPRAGLDLEVKDYANSPNVMRTWLELNQRNSSGNGGGTSLTVPTTFAIFVDNDGDLTSSSGEYPSSLVTPGTLALYLSNTEVIFNDPGNDVDFRVESSTNDHALFVQGSDGHVGIGTVPSSSYALHVSDADGILVESTGTTGIHKIVRGTAASQDSRPVIDIDADTTADAVDGFGPTLRFTFSDTGVDDSELGAIGFVRDGGDGLGKFVVGQDSQQLGSVGATQFSVGNAETVVNDQGVDTDFRVESAVSQVALWVRGSDGKIGINNGGPVGTLHVRSSSTADNVKSSVYVDLPSTATQGYSTLELQGRAGGVDYDNIISASYGLGLLFASPVKHGFNDGTNYTFITRTADTVVNEDGIDHDFRVESLNNQHMLFVDGGNDRVGIACTAPTVALDVTGDINATGALTATTKSFVIDHPTKPNMKLRYGSLEGPENGVYVRGRLRGNVIELPDYWVGLVDEDTITVNLTPIINKQDLFVKEIKDNKVFVEGSDQINCFFTVYGERKDEPRFEVEY